ncbi:StAR-related lipid transfer protein 3 [Penaeus vannamei]|uniref:StAR-related lipid transfer protein 3 n=1 Tax=Penaeus vannamei TaxID=6689 RepID=A0A3R7M8P6_PENVA|nr:StAR-related lipid transfer protein 3 [Penaeus vannamei]
MENDPLLPQLERVRDYLSHYTETVGDFYSPMESPLGSDDDDDGFTRTDYRKLSPEEKQMQASGYDALQKAWETVNSPGWKVEKETSHGDTVSSKVGPKGSKIYKLVGMVEVEPKTLFNEMLFNFENIPTWNKAITLGRVVQTIDSCTDVVYQVAAEGPGGVVSARDFVNVRHWKKIGDCWVSANVSVVHKDEPPQKSIVRGENGPGCWVFSPVAGAPKKCSFQWLLDTDLKGWIPQSAPLSSDWLLNKQFDFTGMNQYTEEALAKTQGEGSPLREDVHPRQTTSPQVYIWPWSEVRSLGADGSCTPFTMFEA